MIDKDAIELEKTYGSSAVANKLRRIADAIEQHTRFQIQVNQTTYLCASRCLC